MTSDVGLGRISRVDVRNSHTDRDKLSNIAPESISEIDVLVTIFVAISCYMVARMALSALLLAIS
jgi:hypothetical protein